ncbi:hypothetical protein AVEN_246383-1 [Araneus ventricosus]|uniref:Uncharacterized protein n=1 Tax=Araneus ventricosus TaxID=182803 RepID=A0A4Y2I6F6_ARAVE|nr:hypothetical protein AVEN_246383-1 [Araneus ventricosus]
MCYGKRRCVLGFRGVPGSRAIPLKIRRACDLLQVKSYVGTKRPAGVMRSKWVGRCQFSASFYDLRNLMVLLSTFKTFNQGRGGLVVRFRPESRRVSSSKLYFTEEPSHIGSVASKIIRSGQMLSRWCGVEVQSELCQLRCRPRYLTAVQNYEICLKITLVLLQNCMSI